MPPESYIYIYFSWPKLHGKAIFQCRLPWLLDQLNLIFAAANDLTLKLGVLLGRDRVYDPVRGHKNHRKNDLERNREFLKQ